MKQVDLSDTALVVLNYNTQKLTISAVNHILSLQTGIHIVLVDNASTDGSLEAFKKEFEGNKFVSIVASKENGGYAKGNNLAFSYVYQMNGIEFVGVMNPDVTIETKDLSLLVDALRSDASLGLVAGRLIFNGEILEPNPCAWKRARVWRWIFCGTSVCSVLLRLVKKKSSFMNVMLGCYPVSKFKEKIALVDNVQGSCFFSRVSTIKKVGGFDERTFLYFEEDILGEKIRHAGLHNAVVSDAWCCHNHKEKKAALVKRDARLFHLRCGYESRSLYVKEYLKYGPILQAMLQTYWALDFYLKRLLIFCLFKK